MKTKIFLFQIESQNGLFNCTIDDSCKENIFFKSGCTIFIVLIMEYCVIKISQITNKISLVLFTA